MVHEYIKAVPLVITYIRFSSIVVGILSGYVPRVILDLIQDPCSRTLKPLNMVTT